MVIVIFMDIGQGGDDDEDGDGSGQNAFLRWRTYIETSHPPQTTMMMKISMKIMVLAISIMTLMVIAVKIMEVMTT